MHEILYTVYILTSDGKSYKSSKYHVTFLCATFHARLIAQSRDQDVEFLLKTENEIPIYDQ